MHEAELELTLRTGSPPSPIPEKNMFPGSTIRPEEEITMIPVKNLTSAWAEVSDGNYNNGIALQKQKGLGLLPFVIGEGSKSGLFETGSGIQAPDEMPYVMGEGPLNHLSGCGCDDCENEFKEMLGFGQLGMDPASFVKGEGSNDSLLGRSGNATQAISGSEGLGTGLNYQKPAFGAYNTNMPNIPTPLNPTPLNQTSRKTLNPTALNQIIKRERRMMRNRESAARSRARRMAYTAQLECDIKQLKEENDHLVKVYNNSLAVARAKIPAKEKPKKIRNSLHRTLSSIY